MSASNGFSYSHRQLRVVFGEGSLDRLDHELVSIGVDQVFLVSTPGRHATMQRLSDRLDNRLAGSFAGAQPHVPAEIVTEAERNLFRAEASGLLAVGGGSAIGLGKVLARRSGLPLAAVPTTYSGSEMTDIWGVTGSGNKETGRDPASAARLVIYDPELTRTLPPEIAGPSGMNAVAHSVEALYSETASPLSSLLAEEGIRLLVSGLPRLVRDRHDYQASRDALIGAHFCGRALDMTTMGLHHKLCHAVGGALGLPHALTHAVLLPYTAAYNSSAAEPAMARISAALSRDSAAAGLKELNERLEIRQTLADLGMKPADVEPIAREVARASYPNPAPVTIEGVSRLLEAALRGSAPE